MEDFKPLFDLERSLFTKVKKLRSIKNDVRDGSMIIREKYL